MPCRPKVLGISAMTRWRTAAVARRTVYRYFPDRQAMMNAALLHVRELAGPQVTYPKDAQDLLNTLEPIYTGFDFDCSDCDYAALDPPGAADAAGPEQGAGCKL